MPKISDLPTGTLSDTDTFPLVDGTTTSKATVAALGAHFASTLLPFYNVKTYGATGDGTTDDTTAIQAAIDAAFNAGGGIVEFPAGTFRCNIALKPLVTLQGVGRSATTLKPAVGSNTTCVKGLDFATLTGKSYAVGDILLGCYEAGLRDLSIDGDKANQSAGWCAELWGRGLVIENVNFNNGNDGGLWTEFTTHDAGAVNDLLEGTFNNIKTSNSGGDGWRFRGPHDSIVTNYVTVSNIGWGFKSETSSGAYRSSVIGSNWNSWLNANSYYFSDAFKLTGSTASAGSTGTGIECKAGIGNCYFEGNIAGHTTGVIVRGSLMRFDVQATSISGTLFQLGETAVASCGYVTINAVGTSIGTGFDRQNVATPLVIFARLSITSTLRTGSSDSQSSYWNCVQVGGAATVLHEMPGTGFTGSGYTPQFPLSNGVLLTRDASGTTVGAAGAASALPANPVAYWTVKDSGGTSYKIPVYNT